MPNSRPPRRAYRGSRSGRDLRSGRLDVDASTPAGRSTPHRTPPQQGVHLGSAGGPGPGAGHTPHVPTGPGHFRGTNRKPVLIAAGVAAAAGGGGLVYDARRRRKRVSKLYDPFSGQTYDFSKKTYTVATHPGDTLHDYNQRSAEVEDRAGRQMNRSAGGGAAGGAVLGGAIGGGVQHVMNRSADRHHARLAPGPGAHPLDVVAHQMRAPIHPSRGIAAAGAAATGAYAGLIGGAIHGRHKALKDLKRRGLISTTDTKRDDVGKAFPVAIPVPSSRSVSPIVPRGRHVSTENDLSVTTRRGRRRGSPSALENYHSGDQSRDSGGGASFGHGARKVSKNSQFAASHGRRGTPLSGIAQAGRVGHRLTIV